MRNADGVPGAPEPDSSSGSKEDERDLRVEHDSFEYDQTIPVFRFGIRSVLKTPLERLKHIGNKADRRQSWVIEDYSLAS